MKNNQANTFLVEDNLELLEESKGAKILIHYPKQIEDHLKTIKYYDDAIIQGEAMVNSKLARADELSNLKGFKVIFSKSKIKQEKEHLIAEIGDWRNKIQDFINQKNELLQIVAGLKKEINAFVKVLLNLNIEPNDVVEEYYRIKKRLESKGKIDDKSEQSVEVIDKKDDEIAKSKENQAIEQNKNKTTKSAIDRFNSRMAKHQEIVKKQNQPGIE